MISIGTMERITRIKRHMRDLSRAEVAQAERRHDEARKEQDRLEEETGRAADALGSLRDSSPDDVELLARVLVESSMRAAEAEAQAHERARELAAGRERRTEAERDVRGLELAGARVQKRAEQRVTRAEERLAELWASRRRP